MAVSNFNADGNPNVRPPQGPTASALLLDRLINGLFPNQSNYPNGFPGYTLVSAFPFPNGTTLAEVYALTGNVGALPSIWNTGAFGDGIGAPFIYGPDLTWHGVSLSS